MLGNLLLGATPLGSAASTAGETSLKPIRIFLTGQPVNISLYKAIEADCATIEVCGIAPTKALRAHVEAASLQVTAENPTYHESISCPVNNYARIDATGEDSSWRMHIWREVDAANLQVEALDEGLRHRMYIGKRMYNHCRIEMATSPAVAFITPAEPTIHHYDKALLQPTRRPVYKIELLRPEDETPYFDITGDVICDSGSVTVEKQDGVRRSSSFELSNIGNKYNEFVEHLTIGSKYRVSLGEELDGNVIFFRKGTYLFDDPSLHGINNDRKVAISGTDKWSVLNGQHGGILEGTYTVEKGSKLGDFVRRTLRLNIVNDPIEPLIHPDLEEMEITYDITKSEGGTISDVFLDVALNLNCSMYYDEYGRFCVVPIDEANNKTVIHRFAPGDNVYIGASKTYNNEKIYNSVLVIGENAQNTETPVRYELVNNDLDDPNSVPNVGIKKVYKVSDYTAGIDTEEKAQWRAIYEMRNIKEKFYAATADFVDILYLDVDQLIELTDDEVASDKERYIITALTHTIGVDMSTSATVSKVSA